MTRVQRVLGGVVSIVAALALGSSVANANEAEFDDHVVYYNVINTTFLSPEVARAYDVRRSSNRAMLNITVMERTDDGLQAVSADISGNAVNMNQQSRSLRFREIEDGDAIYQLSELTVRAGEEMTFNLEITPAGSEVVLPIEFEQKFYVD